MSMLCQNVKIEKIPSVKEVVFTLFLKIEMSIKLKKTIKLIAKTKQGIMRANR